VLAIIVEHKNVVIDVMVYFIFSLLKWFYTISCFLSFQDQ